MSTTKILAFPTKVVILGKTFTICEPDPENEDDGNMDLAAQKITVRKQESMEYNQDTLLHEITHAIDEMLVLGLSEEQVHRMAAGLLSVLKTNKALTKWLTHNVK